MSSRPKPSPEPMPTPLLSEILGTTTRDPGGPPPGGGNGSKTDKSIPRPDVPCR